MINSVLRPVGFNLETTRAEVSELFRLSELGPGHWDVPRCNKGFRMEAQDYISFLREIVSQYRKEYLSFPVESDGTPDGFFLNNDYFGGVDSEVLYAVTRHYQPKVIIEVGSGCSTKVMARAVIDGTLGTRLVSIDPSPRTSVSGVASQQIVCPVEKLTAAEISDQLGPGDILFVDSSHTIATGGDIAFLFLEVLPQLSKGVLVHVHDIFLPFDYPKEWIIGNRWRWTEQYLVHAFLCHNSAYKVLWSSYYMWQNFRESVLEVLPRGATGPKPASLWLMRAD